MLANLREGYDGYDDEDHAANQKDDGCGDPGPLNLDESLLDICRACDSAKSSTVVVGPDSSLVSVVDDTRVRALTHLSCQLRYFRERSVSLIVQCLDRA